MSQVLVGVAAEEVVVIDLVSVAALHQAVVPLLHHLVALDAHPLQIAHAPHPGDEPVDPPLTTVLDHLHHAAHDALVLPARGLQTHDAEKTGPGLRATIAEDYLSTSPDLLPRKTRPSQAHHR
jgi:serine/arginine repetitive matrix protein 1